MFNACRESILSGVNIGLSDPQDVKKITVKKITFII